MNGNAKTRLTVVCLMLAAVGGCGMPKVSDLKPSKIFSLDNTWPFNDDEPEVGTPVRIVGAWTDTVLTQPAQKPQRGFGGRLIFYDNEHEEPVLVEGRLVVYAFDETARDPTDNKPTRRYVFPPEQIPLHMSKSELGASYSFWLPWDEAGGPRTEVSLICRFEPKNGSVVTSEQTRHLLPGAMQPGVGVSDTSVSQLPEGVPSRPAQPTLESIQASRRVDRGVQPAGYESPVDQGVATAADSGDAAASADGKQMTVTSIAVPRHFQIGTGALLGPTAVPPSGATTLPAPSVQQPAAQQQPVQMQQPTEAKTQATGIYPGRAAVNRTPTAPWQAASAMPPPVANGFGMLPTIRPQLTTPQFMTTQFGQAGSLPATSANTAPTQPSNAAPQQPMQQPMP